MKTELRIGNWVNEEIVGNCKVSQILSETIWIEANNVKTDGTFNKVEYHLKYFNPIKLTEEWLLKFGFEHTTYDKQFIIVRGYTDSFEKDDIVILKPDYSQNWGKIKKDEFYCSGTFIGIKHVHQLQNLYFALTGKELIIKTIKNEQKDTTD